MTYNKKTEYFTVDVTLTKEEVQRIVYYIEYEINYRNRELKPGVGQDLYKGFQEILGNT